MEAWPFKEKESCLPETSIKFACFYSASIFLAVIELHYI